MFHYLKKYITILHIVIIYIWRKNMKELFGYAYVLACHGLGDLWHQGYET
jgi:hypothetical protein